MVLINDGIDGRTNGLEEAGKEATLISGWLAATTKSIVLLASVVTKKFKAATAAPFLLPCLLGTVSCVADS